MILIRDEEGNEIYHKNCRHENKRSKLAHNNKKRIMCSCFNAAYVTNFNITKK